MKRLLALLVVVLVGLVFWVRHVSVRPSEAHRAIIAGLKEELAAAEREKALLASELARTKEELAASGRRPSPTADAAPFDSSSPAPAAAAPSAPPATAPESVSEAGAARFAQLRDIYDRNLRALEVEREKAALTLRTAQERREHLRRNPPSFSEQRQAMDIDGNVIGNRGVRTSDADRNRMMELHREEVERLVGSIVESERILKEIQARKARLDEQYRRAVAKAGTP